jgi:hypothetical protein
MHTPDSADSQLRDITTEALAAELRRRYPLLSTGEQQAVIAYIRGTGRRGQHKSSARKMQGDARRRWRVQMDWLKFKLQDDPAGQELKRETIRVIASICVRPRNSTTCYGALASRIFPVSTLY